MSFMNSSEEDEESWQHPADGETFSDADALSTESPESNNDSEDVRRDIVERAIKTLKADAKRCDGILKRDDVNRVYMKRKLRVSECIEVEKALKEDGCIIDESEPVEEYSLNIFGFPHNSRFLTEAEERSLGRQIQMALQLPADRAGLDQQYIEGILRSATAARRRFVESNMRYVEQIARSIKSLTHLTLDDIRQEGLMGLMHATDRYDPELGFRFKTYATWWIQQHIWRSIANNERTIRLPVHVQEKANKIKRARQRLQQTLGRPPKLEELAKHLGYETEWLLKFMWVLQTTDCIEGDEIVAEDTTVLTRLHDESETIFERILRKELSDRVERVLKLLDPREASILRLRFGIGMHSEHTLESVGQQYNVTRERIRQIEAKTLERLRTKDIGKPLKDFVDK